MKRNPHAVCGFSPGMSACMYSVKYIKYSTNEAQWHRLYSLMGIRCFSHDLKSLDHAHAAAGLLTSTHIYAGCMQVATITQHFIITLLLPKLFGAVAP